MKWGYLDLGIMGLTLFRFKDNDPNGVIHHVGIMIRIVYSDNGPYIVTMIMFEFT